VLGVLAFHDDRLPGGYLGVDLFFVLSGFLITSLLLAEWKAEQRISLAAFWIRRARRLFPALLALLPAVALYALLLAESTELGRIRADGVATLAYVANWRAIFSGADYWTLFAAPSPLEHTWSLAIEEQFYVLWPLLVTGLLAWRRGSVRWLLFTCLALAGVSVALMAALFAPDNVSRVYMGTDTRGASILLGAALAAFFALRPKLQSLRAIRSLDVLGGLAFLFLGWAWLTVDGQSPWLYHGGFLLTELAVLVLIACAVHGERSLVARLLSLRPLALAGLVSYGLYLWHWPLFVVFSERRLGLGAGALTLLRVGATLVVTLLSYHYLELPIRRHGLRFGRPWVVVPSAVAAALLTIFLGTRGATAAPRQLGAATTLAPLQATAAGGAASRTVAVFGDSVAESLGAEMERVADDERVVTRAVGDCALLEGVVPTQSLSRRAHQGGNCAEHWAEDAATLRPDVALVVLGGGFFASSQFEGQWQQFCHPAYRAAYKAQLNRRLQELSVHSRRLVVALVPYPLGNWRKGNWDGHVDCFNELLTEVARERQDVTLLELRRHLCPEGQPLCTAESEGSLIRPDGMHFQGKGAVETARWVLSELEGIHRQAQ